MALLRVACALSALLGACLWDMSYLHGLSRSVAATEWPGRYPQTHNLHGSRRGLTTLSIVRVLGLASGAIACA